MIWNLQPLTGNGTRFQPGTSEEPCSFYASMPAPEARTWADLRSCTCQNHIASVAGGDRWELGETTA